MSRPARGRRPAVEPAKAQAARLDLAPFCDQSGRGPAIAQPWTQAGFTYATDMRVLIKLPAREGEASVDFPLTASAEKLFAEHPAPVAARFKPPPPLEAEAPAEVACSECHGSGAVLNGKRKPILCPVCGGEQRTENTEGVTIGKRLLALNYLRLLATLPGVRIAAETGKATDPLRFVFDGGGEGLLMPKTRVS